MSGGPLWRGPIDSVHPRPLNADQAFTRNGRQSPATWGQGAQQGKRQLRRLVVGFAQSCRKSDTGVPYVSRFIARPPINLQIGGLKLSKPVLI
jgi:hypothetical protein